MIYSTPFFPSRRERRVGFATLTALVTLAMPIRAAAQAEQGEFSVLPRLGAIDFDRASSLKTAPFLGLDAEYHINRFFGIGTAVHVARPNTRAEDFLTTLTFGIPTSGDTTFFFQTGQAITLLEGGLLGTLRYPLGRFTPFLTGSAGYYRTFLDPQINRGARGWDGASYSYGGGFTVRFSERSGIQLDVRNLVLTDYERQSLEPSLGRNPNIFFEEDFNLPPDNKSSVNNLVLSLGFRYVPNVGSGRDTPVEADPTRNQRPAAIR
ncbi:MAG: outer membrane beta-barrel protein [Gemmatimonadaceae bacterium]|nr:outer membrane beta-barrel protein [Gemmatimonadaceae bacterium]